MSTEENHTVTETFEVKDHGSEAVHKIGEAFEHAAEKSKELKERVGEFRRESGLTAGALLGIGAGLGAWIEKTKEVNAEFGRTNRMLSGLFSTSLAWNKNVSFVDRYAAASAAAAEQTEDLEKIAGRFGGSLGEVGEQYHQFATELGGLGLSRERLTEITEHVRATSKVIGVDGAQLIEKITNAALFKQVNKKGEAGKFLALALGGGKKIQGMTQVEILEKIDKAMGRLVPAADKMSQGMGDSLNRIHLAVDSLLRVATTPLFKEIGATLSEWSTKMVATKDGMQPIAEVYAQKLVDAFREVKSISAVILSHWKEIAAVWATAKTVTALGALGTAVGAGAGSTAAKGIGGALASRAVATGTGASVVAGGAMAGAAGGALYMMFHHFTKEGRAHDAAIMSLRKELQAGGEGGIGPLLRKHSREDMVEALYPMEKLAGTLARSQGLISGSGYQSVDRSMLFDVLSKLDAKLSIAAPAATQWATYGPSLSLMTPEKFAKVNVTNNFNGGIHIQQNFEDTDPGQVFIRFSEAIHSMVNSPRSSVHATPGGI